MQQQSSIYVRHLNAHYVVAHQPADAVLVQRRLDRIARELLSRHLEQCFAALSDNDAAFYFIKRMSVNAALDLNWDDDRLARTWAQAVRDRMLHTIGRGGSLVKVFRDRAEYVTHFLEDLVRGQAWEHWYYRAFEPLRDLPTGRIVVRVLTEDADAGRDALLELTRRGELDALLAALGDAEAEEAVNACLLPQGRRVLLPHMFAAWVDALRRALRETPLTAVLARDVARLYLNILRARPELGPDVNLARFVRDVLAFGQSVRASPSGRHLLAMLKSDDPSGAAHQLGGSERELLSQLVHQLGGEEVAGLLYELHVESSRNITRSISTRYGGVFLLAPVIAEDDGLRELLRSSPYPQPSFASKEGLFSYLVALQCLGLSNAREARRDGALALFAGLAATPDDAQLKRYCEGLTTTMHEGFSRECQSWRRGLSRRRAFIATEEGGPTEARGEAAWFSLFAEEEPVLQDTGLDRALIPLSRTVMRVFAAKLGAFADSSPQYLSRNFLESHAEVLVSEEHVTVHFLTCPLQMVLRMAGFDHRTWALPWLENRLLEFRFD